MINKWKSLSEESQVALIILILSALFSVVDYFWKNQDTSQKSVSRKSKANVMQTSEGINSPIVSDTQGDVIISIDTSGSGKQM